MPVRRHLGFAADNEKPAMWLLAFSLLDRAE
jgi:hypothetical protein